MARPARDWHFVRAESAAAVEHKRECSLAGAIAGAGQFDPHCLGPKSLHHPSRGEPSHGHVLQARRRQIAVAIRRDIPGERSDARNQSALLRFASDRWRAGDRLVRFRRTLLLRSLRKGTLAPRPRQKGAHLGQRRLTDHPRRPRHPEFWAGRTDVFDRRQQKDRPDGLASR